MGVVVCPSCSMEASVADRRQLRPIASQGEQVDSSTSVAPRLDLRACRNCRAVIDVSDGEPQIAQPLASF